MRSRGAFRKKQRNKRLNWKVAEINKSRGGVCGETQFGGEIKAMMD